MNKTLIPEFIAKPSRTWARLCAAVAVLSMGLGVVALPASAGPVMAITSFTATPSSISNVGEILTLDGLVQNATSCTFSTTSIIPVGLPTTGACQNGTPRQQITIPANPGKAISFTFKITATDGNKHLTKTVVVKQAATLKTTQILAGGNYSCAIAGDKTARCWGLNAWGQLGDGTTTPSRTPPKVGILGLANVTAISTGSGDYSCALIKGGTVKCWGYNGSGQLGDGTTINRSTAVAVKGLKNVTAISTGASHSCALILGGTVKCWGSGGFGQLGDGAKTDSSTPVAVTGLVGAFAISTSWELSCALIRGGTVKCWGKTRFTAQGDPWPLNQSTPVAVPGLANVTAISLGTLFTCALIKGGTVKCWGYNGSGQLGDGTTTERWSPVAVTGLANVTAISSGGFAACALISGGTVKCWGGNGFGNLGNSTFQDSLGPVAVTGLVGAIAISHGDETVCALLAGGTAVCWGRDSEGQYGNGTSFTMPFPQRVNGLSGP
jgi:alpha-tubulin suppressor-like RCC1 family protein